MYFVQDYEPYFYAYGGRGKTYELGLHITGATVRRDEGVGVRRRLSANCI